MIKLNPLQKEMIKAIRREDKLISLQSGWGAGKSSGLVFALIYVMATRPGCRFLFVTDTYVRLQGVVNPEISKWSDRLGLGWTYNQQLSVWSDPTTGSRCHLKNYNRASTQVATMNPLEGINADGGVCFIDEAQVWKASEVFNKAIARMRSHKHKPIVMICGLPVVDAWWVELAEQSGFNPLKFTSYANQDNLSAEWFESLKLLPEDERLAMVMNQPKPPSGQVYSEIGNDHIIKDWEYKPEMTGRLAIDYGFRKPSVLIICYDEERQASVICGEINPQEVTIEQLSKLILAIAWPRELRDQAPGDRIWIDSAVCDPAGLARSDQTGLSAIKVIRRLPNDGGIGVPVKYTTDPVRRNISNGVMRLKRALSRKQYLITDEVWRAGQHASGNSLRKAIASYSWDKSKALPKKDDREDRLDALRYDCIMHYWGIDYRGQARTTSRKTRAKRRNVKTGGSRTAGF